MNKLLLDIARRLKYRKFPEVVGTELSVDALSSIYTSVSAFAKERVCIEPRMPDDLPRANLGLAGGLGKYGLIDFQTECDLELEPRKTENARLLREYGFTLSPDEIELLSDFGEEPDYCLQQLVEEIDTDQMWLRLFFNTTSKKFHDLDIKQKFAQTKDAELIEFPLDFKCTDACVTNAPSIWFNRHFYF